MSWKKIETSREIRLWIKEIIVPTLMWGATIMYFFPGVRHAAIAKARRIKESIREKFSKEGA